MHNRYQRVFSKGKSSQWENANAGVPQRSAFVIYFNDIPQGLDSDVKLFAVDTSLFSVIHDVGALSATLNDDLFKIQDWSNNWKITFNSDRNKQVQKVIFSRRTRRGCHPNLYFNNQPTERSVAHRYLILNLDERLSFTNCINDKSNKIVKGVSLLCKLITLLPRQSLLTNNKSFTR